MSATTEHTRAVKQQLSALIEDLRHRVRQLDEPQAKALFETAAETLGGLREAVEDYEVKDEAAWTGEEE